ncbi:hypothetical protein B0H11DRAFT_1917685 [Mycena galericulata]|nr:hypothetical protein B0H11DRAFT_1917685 [Mycena galericulata]
MTGRGGGDGDGHLTTLTGARAESSIHRQRTEKRAAHDDVAADASSQSKDPTRATHSARGARRWLRGLHSPIMRTARGEFLQNELQLHTTRGHWGVHIQHLGQDTSSTGARTDVTWGSLIIPPNA